MVTIAAILARVLVVPFYKVNTGFFLFLFFVLFGLMDAREIVLYHSSLMQTIVASSMGLAIAMAVILAYSYKTAAYVLKAISGPEQGFLMSMQALPKGQQVGVLLFCQMLLALPVLLYIGVTMTIGLQHGFIGASVGLLCFVLACCFAAAWLYFRKLNSYHKPAFKLPTLVPFNYSTLPVLYPFHYLLHDHKLAFLAVKVFSGVVFYLVFIVNHGTFSLNYFRLLFMLCAAAHSMLVYYSVDFTEKQLAFTRTLPLTRTKRLSSYFLTFALLLLPELCLLLVYASSLITWPELLLTFGIGLSQLLLLMALLYLPDMHLQRFGLFTCLVYLGSAMLLPSGVAIVLFSQLTIALLIFYSRYYKFELITND